MLATNLTVLLFFRPSARGNRTGRKVYQWDPNNRSLSLIILQKEKNVHPSQWIWFYRSFVTEWSRSAVNVDWRFRGCFLFIFARLILVYLWYRVKCSITTKATNLYRFYWTRVMRTRGINPHATHRSGHAYESERVSASGRTTRERGYASARTHTTPARYTHTQKCHDSHAIRRAV